MTEAAAGSLSNSNSTMNTSGEQQSFKGKPSSFFAMQVQEQPFRDQNGIQTHFLLNESQWNFIFENYPEYSSDPYELMQWLQEKTLENEKNGNHPQYQSMVINSNS